MTNERRAKIQRVIDSLRGSTDSIEATCEEEDLNYDDELRQPEFNMIDEQIFLCETCGWWCETSEMSQDVDSVCNDCES